MVSISSILEDVEKMDILESICKSRRNKRFRKNRKYIENIEDLDKNS